MSTSPATTYFDFTIFLNHHCLCVQGMSAMQWAVREAASEFVTGKVGVKEDVAPASELLKIVRMLLAAGSNPELSSKSVNIMTVCNPTCLFVNWYMHRTRRCSWKNGYMSVFSLSICFVMS